MELLDVNALVALAWDSHIYHPAIRKLVCREGRERLGHLSADGEWLRPRFV